MDIRKIVSGLHPLERKVLPVLKGRMSVSEICKTACMQEVAVVRAIGWLESKKVAKLDIRTKELVDLGENGRKYAEDGLPEVRFLKALKDSASVDDLAKAARLSKQEVSPVLGVLRKKHAILISKEKGGLFVSLTGEAGMEFPEEKLLKKLPCDLSELSGDEKEALKSLRNRKNMVSVTIVKEKFAELTDLGIRVQSAAEDADVYIDKLTPEILRTGGWKDIHLRPFDTKAPVHMLHAGKLQNYRHFLDGVRKKFIALGFEEMTGPIVENDFWDMDALFMPQFHSARDIHEAYYVKKPKESPVPSKLLHAVAQAHETGGDTGSKGWKYKFDRKRTLRCLLRTQGTACSARKLADPDIKIPGKYFGITRCFRYDVIDATHLPDFNQVEGIVIEEGLTLRHLVGLLRMFAKEIAQSEEVRVVPGYFPFTEPSAELFAKHPKLGWIELGGAGIFRPEVVKSLFGKEITVLAWGLGVDRLGMFNLGIRDIRDLFSHDINVLRNARNV